MDDASSLFIPFWYSIKRETLRFRIDTITAIGRAFQSLFLSSAWIPVYAFLFLPTPFDLKTITDLTISLVAFILIYESGYIFTDTVSIKKEDSYLRNVVFQKPIASWKISLSIILRLVCFTLLIFSDPGLFTLHVLEIYGLLFGIFLIHGLLPEQFRVPSFLGLRVIKGYAPYAFLLIARPVDHLLLIFLGIMGQEIFATIDYAIRKLGGKKNPHFYHLRYVSLRFAIVLFLAIVVDVFFLIDLLMLAKFLLIIAGHQLLEIVIRAGKARLSGEKTLAPL